MSNVLAFKGKSEIMPSGEVPKGATPEQNPKDNSYQRQEDSNLQEAQTKIEGNKLKDSLKLYPSGDFNGITKTMAVFKGETLEVEFLSSKTWPLIEKYLEDRKKEAVVEEELGLAKDDEKAEEIDEPVTAEVGLTALKALETKEDETAITIKEEMDKLWGVMQEHKDDAVFIKPDSSKQSRILSQLPRHADEYFLVTQDAVDKIEQELEGPKSGEYRLRKEDNRLELEITGENFKARLCFVAVGEEVKEEKAPEPANQEIKPAA